MCTLVPEAYFYSLLANFATRTAPFTFFYSARLGASIAASRRKFANKKDIKRKPLARARVRHAMLRDFFCSVIEIKLMRYYEILLWHLEVSRQFSLSIERF